MAKTSAGMVATKIETVSIDVPVRHTGQLAINRIDIQLTPAQAKGWRDLYDGLYGSRAALKSGREIRNPQDALRWLLEQLEI